MATSIRELKDHLSRYIRRVEAGERIAVTAHGRVVAELVPPSVSKAGHSSRYDELVASGVIRPALDHGIRSKTGQTSGCRLVLPRP